MHFFFFFQGTTDPIDLQLIKKKILDTGRNRETFFMDPFDGFRHVKSGHFAFFCEEPIANRVIGKIFRNFEICQTIKLSLHRRDPGALMIKKLSPFRERFVINFLWTKETGVFHKIFQHWNSLSRTCMSYDHFESVRFEYLAPIFIALALVYMMSLTILLSEICVNKILKYKMKQKLCRNIPRRRF